MKKIIVFLLFLFIFISKVNASGSILIEYSTNEILMEENSKEHMAPASMTKMMTLLIAMEKIDSGKIKFSDKVVVSKNASDMGGSQIFLKEGESITVEKLIRSICISSANDAAVALAEYIAGSEEKFVKLMNNKVKKLGLSNTNFENVHGLDSDNHYSCPYDMAIIAKNLINHEKILEYTSTYEEYLKKEDGSSIWMVNTNKLIKYYKNLDGLKTGFTDKAGYCLTATAKRNDLRLISVVMGSDTIENRSKKTTELLDYGFNNYKLNKIINKDINLGKIKVINGKKDYVKLKLKEDIVDLSSIEDDFKYSHKIEINEITAPVKVGDNVGKLILYRNKKKYKEYDITVKENINKSNIWDKYKNNFKYIVTGNV